MQDKARLELTASEVTEIGPLDVLDKRGVELTEVDVIVLTGFAVLSKEELKLMELDETGLERESTTRGLVSGGLETIGLTSEELEIRVLNEVLLVNDQEFLDCHNSRR